MRKTLEFPDVMVTMGKLEEVGKPEQAYITLI
jgi:hypothetical protein